MTAMRALAGAASALRAASADRVIRRHSSSVPRPPDLQYFTLL